LAQALAYHKEARWDTANKATELADYSVCTTWGVKQKHYYLIDVFRQKLNYPELKLAVRAQATRFGAQTVLIEDRASGTQLIQELVREELQEEKQITPDADKIMRLHAQTGAIENGFVHLPRSAPWLEEYLAELMTFPKSRHDDQVDSTSQALAFLGSGPDWLEQMYMLMHAQFPDTPLPPSMAYLAPPRPPPQPSPPPRRVTEVVRDPVTGREMYTISTWAKGHELFADNP
jgi:predicted phage terminase large subunit-like protein